MKYPIILQSNTCYGVVLYNFPEGIETKLKTNKGRCFCSVIIEMNVFPTFVRETSDFLLEIER